MAEIALHPFHQTTKIKLVCEIPSELAQDLERYKTFYKQAYGADVSEADLLREMARRRNSRRSASATQQPKVDAEQQ